MYFLTMICSWDEWASLKIILCFGGTQGVLCNIGYPSETHLKLKSREYSFVHNICLGYPIILKFYTEHGSDTAVLCAKFQNAWIIETDVRDEHDFARFEFKMSFGWISYIAQHPWILPGS